MSDYLMAVFAHHLIDHLWITGILVGPRYKILAAIRKADQQIYPARWYAGDGRFLTYQDAEDYKDHWSTRGISASTAVEIQLLLGNVVESVAFFGIFPTPDTLEEIDEMQEV